MTIDPGAGKERYQGVVDMNGDTTLTAAALGYFGQSEQIPTFLKIAVARQYLGGGGQARRQAQRQVRRREAGRPGTGARAASSSRSCPREGQSGLDADAEEDWRRAEALASTVEDHELLDPTLPADRLLYRLFHEERVRAFKAKPLAGPLPVLDGAGDRVAAAASPARRSRT